MRFNKYIPLERRDFLEKQYKEYIKTTPMTKKEQRALREWVKEGNSVYENSMSAWQDGQIPVEFLSVYRDEEYIREHTKGMDAEAARKFALAYYGWDDEPNVESIPSELPNGITFEKSYADEELPFQ